MLTADALEYLRGMAIAAAGPDYNTDHGYLLLPQGYQAESLDRFMERPAHFREQFKTHHMNSFVEYCAGNHGGQIVLCYVDQDKMSASVIFDAGVPCEPGHRYHTATLTLQMGPLYQSLLKISGTTIEQRELAEWLEDWRFDITTESANNEEIELGKVITAVRQFSTESKTNSSHNEESMAASRSAFASIEAANKHNLPAYIVADCKPYSDLEDHRIPMRFSTRLSTTEKPVFALTMVKPDVIRQTLAEDFVKAISIAMTEHAGIDTHSVLIGTV